MTPEKRKELAYRFELMHTYDNHERYGITVDFLDFLNCNGWFRDKPEKEEDKPW